MANDNFIVDKALFPLDIYRQAQGHVGRPEVGYGEIGVLQRIWTNLKGNGSLVILDKDTRLLGRCPVIIIRRDDSAVGGPVDKLFRAGLRVTGIQFAHQVEMLALTDPVFLSVEIVSVVQEFQGNVNLILFRLVGSRSSGGFITLTASNLS